MKGVLILAHGSRQKATEQTMDTVVEMTRELLPDVCMEIAYMEFGEKNISTGLDALAGKGADDIAVVPYFLFDGVHIREDIPEALEAYGKGHPGMRITMGKTLGADKRLAEILSDRIRECL